MSDALLTERRYDLNLLYSAAVFSEVHDQLASLERRAVGDALFLCASCAVCHALTTHIGQAIDQTTLDGRRLI